MPRTLVAPVTSGPGGAGLGYTAPNVDGDAVPPGCLLIVRNTDATTAMTVTVVTGGKQSGLDVADIGPVNIPAASSHIFGPFLPRETFAQPAGTEVGRVHVNYSRATGTDRVAVAL